MNNHLRRTTVCFFLLAVLTAGGLASARADVFKPNTSYPELHLLDGKNEKLVNLQSLTGKKTVLFLFASW